MDWTNLFSNLFGSSSANNGSNIGSYTSQYFPQSGGTSGNTFGNLFSKSSMFGDKNSTGWLSTAAGIGEALFSAYSGNKTLQLAEDQFDESKREFNLNYAAQTKTTNTELEDRQNARVASNPDAYESTASYMARNKV